MSGFPKPVTGGSGITSLTGDVTATGPGAAAATLVDTANVIAIIQENIPASTAPVLRSTSGPPVIISTDQVGDFAFDSTAIILYGPLGGTPGALGTLWTTGPSTAPVNALAPIASPTFTGTVTSGGILRTIGGTGGVPGLSFSSTGSNSYTGNLGIGIDGSFNFIFAIGGSNNAYFQAGGANIVGVGSAGSLALGSGVTPPSVASTFATAPPTSATIQTALGALALGTALHNTLSYDVRLTVYLSITANTSGVVKLGVGTTTTPTQTTIITGVTTIGFVPITFKIPAGQYALLSISGTVTDSIAGQYFEAA